jgi:hypothetical protein
VFTKPCPASGIAVFLRRMTANRNNVKSGMSDRGGGRGNIVLIVSALTALVLVGCATKEVNGDAPRPRNGIAEYQQIAADAEKSMRTALAAIERVSARTNSIAPGLATAYSEEVERLEIGSVQVRARSQAMQARGKAYFENWQENLAGVRDARVRALAQEHRADLERSFENIKLASQQTRQVFEQFLSGMRRLRTALENDSSTMAAESTKDLVQLTVKQGRQVEQGLAGIRHELQQMTVMLTPGKAGSKD